MKMLAKVVLVLMGVSVYSVIIFGMCYWTRDGQYAAGTQIPWFLFGGGVFFGIPLALLLIIVVGKLVGKLFEIAGWSE